jgi:cystathionine gamma-synthase
VHAHNALELANWLTRQPQVRKVYFPGLPSHPGYEIARRQQSGFGAIVTFELAGGIPAVKALVSGLKCFSLAESLGGVESLVAHPGSMTHAAMSESARRAAGLTDGLLRLSVGIEALEDLRADLAAGLERAAAS